MSEDINRSIRIYSNTTRCQQKYDDDYASTERLTKSKRLQRGRANA